MLFISNIQFEIIASKGIGVTASDADDDGGGGGAAATGVAVAVAVVFGCMVRRFGAANKTEWNRMDSGRLSSALFSSYISVYLSNDLF